MSGGEPGEVGRRTVEVFVRGDITLGQLLKLAGVAGSGGQAKALLFAGAVTVNGQPEERRGRKLVVGDLVGLSDQVLLLVGDSESPPGEGPVAGDISPADRD